jgi:ubiquinone/menaquinone biosynthesis C-methylase UbiE
MTSATLFLRLCNAVVWGIGDDREYTDTLLSFVPSDFDGVLLDVPVGTGIFTSALYAAHPSATIIALDSSMGMLQKARQRFAADGLTNVRLVRADAANLPFKDGVFDIVLSMNGLHVFVDKPRVIAQMRRVLRKNATLIACGYVKGVKKRSDWFVRHFGVRKGFFNPPFLTLDNVASQFDGFAITRRANFKSGVYFEAVKNA